jgi:hypothetical protein
MQTKGSSDKQQLGNHDGVFKTNRIFISSRRGVEEGKDVHSLTFFKFSSKYLSLRIASTRGMLKPNCEAMCRAVLFTGSATCIVKMEERRVSDSGVGGLKDLFRGNG